MGEALRAAETPSGELGSESAAAIDGYPPGELVRRLSRASPASTLCTAGDARARGLSRGESADMGELDAAAWDNCSASRPIMLRRRLACGRRSAAGETASGGCREGGWGEHSWLGLSHSDSGPELPPSGTLTASTMRLCRAATAGEPDSGCCMAASLRRLLGVESGLPSEMSAAMLDPFRLSRLRKLGLGASSMAWELVCCTSLSRSMLNNQGLSRSPALSAVAPGAGSDSCCLLPGPIDVPDATPI
mmetsp:Transcript_39823/g.88531  ORF Transcript_39823/g.88531 Transcript_39823/m.88531 type:complete len:247 (+) Transcript_39823:1211-1951(+)